MEATIIDKRFKNISGKIIQFPLRISDGFQWSPNEEIIIKQEQKAAGSEDEGYIVENPFYQGAHDCYRHGWISKKLLKENFARIYTMEDAKNIKTDLDVMYLPIRIYCDSEKTISLINKRLAECHIGTSINRKDKFIQA